jgi:hypothetical protein
MKGASGGQNDRACTVGAARCDDRPPRQAPAAAGPRGRHRRGRLRHRHGDGVGQFASRVGTTAAEREPALLTVAQYSFSENDELWVLPGELSSQAEARIGELTRCDDWLEEGNREELHAILEQHEGVRLESYFDEFGPTVQYSPVELVVTGNHDSAVVIREVRRRSRARRPCRAHSSTDHPRAWRTLSTSASTSTRAIGGRPGEGGHRRVRRAGRAVLRREVRHAEAWGVDPVRHIGDAGTVAHCDMYAGSCRVPGRWLLKVSLFTSSSKAPAATSPDHFTVTQRTRLTGSLQLALQRIASAYASVRRNLGPLGAQELRYVCALSLAGIRSGSLQVDLVFANEVSEPQLQYFV